MPNNDILKIEPVESYSPPKIPTFDDDNSAMLKKLPSRWQRNAKVLACIGIAGTIMLAGCLGNNELDVTRRMNHGGFASSPAYVVHLTEQEAFGIARSRLERAGFDFSETPPDVSVEIGGVLIGIDLFDAERNVAIAFVGASNEDFSFFPHEWLRDEFVSRIESGLRSELARQNISATVGVVYNRGLLQYDVTEMSRSEARRYMRDDIIRQVDWFVLNVEADEMWRL